MIINIDTWKINGQMHIYITDKLQRVDSYIKIN
jgi:hypothetical protein